MVDMSESDGVVQSSIGFGCLIRGKKVISARPRSQSTRQWAKKSEDKISNFAPFCFSSRLKHIEMSNFAAEISELIMVKILLEKAIMLEKLVISCDEDGRDPDSLKEMQREAREKILTFPKGYLSCIISFYDNDQLDFGSL